MTGASWNLSRATVWLDRGATRRLERGFAAFEAWRDELLEEEETRARTSSTARSSPKSTGCATASPARRKRNVRRVGELAALRERAQDRAAPPATVDDRGQRGGRRPARW